MAVYEVTWRAEGVAVVEANDSAQATNHVLNEVYAVEELVEVPFRVSHTEQVRTRKVED